MDRARQLLRDLVAINSVNPSLVPGAPGEGAAAACLAACLRESGLDVTEVNITVHDVFLDDGSDESADTEQAPRVE